MGQEVNQTSPPGGWAGSSQGSSHLGYPGITECKAKLFQEPRERGISRTGVGGAPVFELHHLLLPRTQAPSLGADGEYAVFLYTHLVQLSAVKLCLFSPLLQLNLLVTWEEERPGRGVQSRTEAS